MASVLELLCKNLIWGSWSSVSAYLLSSFLYLIRYRRNCGFGENISDDSKVVIAKTNEEIDSKRLGIDQDFLEFSNIENDGVGEKEEHDVFFSFKFPNFEEFDESKRDVESSPVSEKYFDEYSSQKDENQDEFEEKDDTHEEILQDSHEKVDRKVDEQNFNQESVYSHVNSNTDPITSNNFHSSMSNPFDAYSDDDDFEEKEDTHEELLQDSNQKVDQEVDGQNFNQESVYSHVNSNTDSITSNSFNSSTCNPFDAYDGDDDFGRKSVDIKESGGKNLDSNDKSPSNDSKNKLESEHQKLIEQLKMEIKKVKVIGLPTILEEPESPPKTMELKPRKIKEEYQNVAQKLNEIHKFHKIYEERMRKFDIFSYQKMYATGFLRLNDPFHSVSSSRSLVPEITTHLCKRFSSTKRENNPSRKFIKELQNGLEVVYVGQMCLSWEILHWQYEKVLEIWESDPRGVRQFQEVFGEFQRFLVSVQRFLEEETFHGPRVPNYVKTRCVFRNLLQVPVVREDTPKKKRKARSQADGNGKSCDMVVEILEESIRLFWHFIRADKYTRKTPLEFQKPKDSRLFMEVQKELHKVKKLPYNQKNRLYHTLQQKNVTS